MAKQTDEFDDLEDDLEDGFEEETPKPYEPPVPGKKRERDMLFSKPPQGANGGHKTLVHTKRELVHAFRLSLMGGGSKELADFFGVQVYTIDYWKKTKPEFALAVRKGKEYASMKVGKSLYKICVGYTVVETKEMTGTNSKGDPISYTITTTRHIPPNIKAIIFFLTNKERALWTDTTKLELSGSVDAIKKLDMSKLSPEEQALAKKIAILQISGLSGTSAN